MSDEVNRFVFDTSTLVGAVLRPQSVPAQALKLAAGAGVVVVSIETLDELTSVLNRASFDRYRDRQERSRFAQAYAQAALMIQIQETVSDCRDPKDNKFLSLAISAGARAIVSSDDDLRVLHPFRGIPVLSPSQFLAAGQRTS